MLSGSLVIMTLMLSKQSWTANKGRGGTTAWGLFHQKD